MRFVTLWTVITYRVHAMGECVGKQKSKREVKHEVSELRSTWRKYELAFAAQSSNQALLASDSGGTRGFFGEWCSVCLRVSVAAGLFYLAELAEEYTVLTRKCIRVTIYVRSVCS